MQIDLAVKAVSKTFDDFMAVDNVSFEVADGSFFSILGPSGCGKTTLLRMIAGLTEPSAGTIEIRGKSMLGIPPNKRPVNLIFQHLALFPMMNVGENIAFGLHRRGDDKATIRNKVNTILERVDLAGFADKKVDQLSGGQKQRVAIARCLVLEPTVLLLDEPLGALDLKLREQMKVELKKLQAKVGTTFVYITHDQSEALVMSDHVAVMNQGVFEQIDTPQNLYNNPHTPFVAQFVGDNNTWSGRVRQCDHEAAEIETTDGRVFRTKIRMQMQTGNEVDLFLRPEAMLIQPDASLANLNRFEVVVRDLLFDGANSRLLANPLDADTELLIAMPQTHQYDYIQKNDKIEIGWDEQSGICFPRKEDQE
ncbi:MAG: ABC transporter ATP-binding protein [Desulfobacterales bacterium]|jgi:spermidine/putrescine transport system ATP-binding protein